MYSEFHKAPQPVLGVAKLIQPAIMEQFVFDNAYALQGVLAHKLNYQEELASGLPCLSTTLL